MEWYENIKQWFIAHPDLIETGKFIGIIIFSFIIYWITKKIIMRYVRKIVQKTKTQLDDLLLSEKNLRRAALIIPIYLIQEFAYLVPSVDVFIARVAKSLIVFIILLLISELITAGNTIYEQSTTQKKRSIKGYLQVGKIVMFVLGGILIIGFLSGTDPWGLLTGLGAMTAVLLLIFRDTLLSFVASIQITSYDLIQKGDWITVPKFDADGDVIDIALHTVTVQNFDKTISIIPTSQLVESGFKNWRGMTQSGGRRIMRNVIIDVTTIKFCTEEMLERFKKFQLIREYVEQKLDEIQKYNEEHKFDLSQTINGRRLTNVGTFRAYLERYLKSRSDVSKDFTFLIRQLAPNSEGLPIQLYIFTTTTNWVEYEGIQSDIFDHILAVIPEFDLKLYQNPTGNDFKHLLQNSDISTGEPPKPALKEKN